MNLLKEFSSKFFKPNIQILLFSLFLFLIIFPLSNSISFYQNDDWVYYRVIKQFLTGNYDMPGYIEALFYTQGFLGTLFAKFFGVEKLPVLTLVMSCLSFFIFTTTINKFYLKNTFNSILSGLILFVSPLYMYSTLGFMSEMYFIFFLVLGFYFFENYLDNGKRINLFWFNLTIIIGFFVRQLAIFSGIAAILILIKNKKYKEAIFQTVFSIGLYLAYQYVVPKTGTMKKHGIFEFDNLSDTSFITTTLYVGLAYATVFIFPMLLVLGKRAMGNKPKALKILGVISLTIVFYLAIFFILNPEYTENPTMYYLKNTVNQNGFFYGNSLGNKYDLINHIEIYNYIELLTKVSVAIFTASIVFLYKKLLNFYVIFAFLYLGFMLVLGGGLYDRYFLPLIPVTILFIVSLKPEFDIINQIIISIFILLATFYSYNFSMDFVILNNKMWEIGNKISLEQNIGKDLISAGNGWNRTYLSKTLRYKYVFYFGPRSDDKELSCCFKLYDTYEVFYPFNIFKDSKIFLYKREN